VGALEAEEVRWWWWEEEEEEEEVS